MDRIGGLAHRLLHDGRGPGLAHVVARTSTARSPGQTIELVFTLNYPDVFMYHCGTAMILEHIASGMYGACSALIHPMIWHRRIVRRQP